MYVGIIGITALTVTYGRGDSRPFHIQKDEHLLTVLRYIERNPLRAGLVPKAEDWSWSSLRHRIAVDSSTLLHPGPTPEPKDWVHWVNQAQSTMELEEVRRSVNRGTPYGASAWARQTAVELGLEASLKPRGRPRKEGNK